MHTIKKVFFITSLFFIAGCSTPPQTYYLDATNGNDTNSGLSADNAWKTLERIKKTSPLIPQHYYKIFFLST